ncbi:MAG: XRE family transcriptional regulator [Spirochaetales bacterium]|nr:XRE family transcriptional regulator [Spirochaetales bacterium]
MGGVEAEAREVNDRLVKLIVGQFGVSETWLRTGTGEMFVKPADNEKSAKMLSLFNDLPPKYQDVVLGVIDLLRKAKEDGKK